MENMSIEDEPTKPSKRALWIAPVMLALGFGLGTAAHSSGNAILLGLAEPLDSMGQLWLNGLKLAVIPLTSILLVIGIGSLPDNKALGRWGSFSLASFIVLLLCGAAFAVAVGYLHVALIPPGVTTLTAASALPVPDNSMGYSAWFTGLIPANFLESATKGELLPVAIASGLFGLALRQIATNLRLHLLESLTAIRQTILVYVRWVMWLLPIGGFALAYALMARSGSGFAVNVIHFLLYAAALLMVFLILLVVVAGHLSKVGIRRFATCALSAQATAFGSRSSLASLPATVESAEKMGLPNQASQICLPMAVSIFKLNRSVTAPSKVIFFSAAFGVTLEPGALLAFIATTMLISLSTPGLPSGAGASNFGAYVEAGLPPEGVVLFEAINPILDPINTAINVTGNLAVAAMVSRFAPVEV